MDCQRQKQKVKNAVYIILMQRIERKRVTANKADLWSCYTKGKQPSLTPENMQSTKRPA
jgi:hypothetical protein